MNKITNIFPKALVVLVLVISAWFFVRFGKESYVFYGDSMGYYMYLPTTFIYHNHKALDWLPADKHFDHTVKAIVAELKDSPRTPKGYIIDKYTYGVAAMEAPFFLMAHAYEKVTGGEANGYSASYGNMLRLAMLVYALMGLWLVYKILCTFFSKGQATTGAALIFVGTNLFWFTLYQAGMAHVPLFFLYALLIYLTIQLYQKPAWGRFALLGLTAGLITVIRPTDVICLLIPLLYGVFSKQTLRGRMQFFSKHLKEIAIALFAFILPLVPQMLYWKKFAGSFFYYSYGKEGFNWLSPEILDGLFSAHNGWLVYTPLMGLALSGILLLKKIKPVGAILCTLLPLYLYIIYSWYCYNYINGLGSRPMIHMYPLLAIPLTALLAYVAQLKKWLLWPFAFIVTFLATINLIYSVQQARGILLSEESNATYNLHMLFKNKASYDDMVCYDVQQVQPKAIDLSKICELAAQHYEDSASDHFVRDTSGRSRFVYHLLDGEEYQPYKLEVTYSKEKFKDAPYIKCSGKFLCTRQYMYYKHLFTILTKRSDQTLSWDACKIDNKLIPIGAEPMPDITYTYSLLNTWGYIYFYIKVPKGLQDGDHIILDVWNIGKQEMYMDDLSMELYGK